MGVDAGCYLSENPHFCKSALSRYTQWDFLALVDQYNIAWHEKTLGQLFCDGSARQIVAMLLDECAKGGVNIRLGAPIGAVDHRDGQYHVAGASARNLVIATGGPSIPKMGASGLAYDIARQFGLNIIPPRPALVPFTLGGGDQGFKDISGLSVPAIARVGDVSFQESALFTHRGLSGPAILQISSYWEPGQSISLNLFPAGGALDALKQAKAEMPRAGLKAALAQHFPKRLADVLDHRFGMAQQLANIPDATLADIAAQLTTLAFTPTGTEGYAKAEVTAGGVDTAGLSSKTMEAKTTQGLFVVGEAVDVTGWLGGYNFQWAWSSGGAAGREIGKRCSEHISHHVGL